MPTERPEEKLLRLLGEGLLRSLLERLSDDRGKPGIDTGENRGKPGIDLKHVHRQLLKHATAEPVPAKKLIVLAGYKHNSYARGAVAELLRAGLLRRVPGGVCLPDSQGVT